MKRSLRPVKWHGVLIGVLLVAAPTPALSQNTFPSSGNVGIGTTTPVFPLEVNGAAKAQTYFVLPAATGSEWWNGAFTVLHSVGDYQIVNRRISDGVWTVPFTISASTGYVGVGTTTPGVALEVNGATKARSYFILPAAIGSEWWTGTFTVLPSVGDYQIVNRRISDGVWTAPFAISASSGNVGIGTTIPAAKLHVVGDAQVDGNLAAKYQDVAEWVQAPGPLAAGVVVVVDPRSRNQVLEASESYDTRVAGVVSSRPGLLLGEAGQNRVKVAHSGRVKVKVDTSYGPIAVGDLLVTSPTPGHAMRSQPLQLGGTPIHRPGTLLGKALEPLDAGQGEILVLLTLQ